MYSEKVLKRFIDDPNAGDLKGANAYSTVKSKKFGDIIKISLKINENLIIEDARYKAFGGVASSVYSSAVCDLVKGKNIILIQNLTSDDVIKYVGKFPEEKQPIASLAVIALNEAIKKYIKKYRLNQ